MRKQIRFVFEKIPVGRKTKVKKISRETRRTASGPGEARRPKQNFGIS